MKKQSASLTFSDCSAQVQALQTSVAARAEQLATQREKDSAAVATLQSLHRRIGLVPP